MSRCRCEDQTADEGADDPVAPRYRVLGERPENANEKSENRSNKNVRVWLVHFYDCRLHVQVLSHNRSLVGLIVVPV